MFIQIKQIILENKFSNFYNNIAAGKSNFKYSQKDKDKDLNVLGFSGFTAAPIGTAVGAAADALYDGSTTNLDGTSQDEPTGNGLVIGGLAAGLGSTALGLNNNHQIINKEKVQKLRDYLNIKYGKKQPNP